MISLLAVPAGHDVVPNVQLADSRAADVAPTSCGADGSPLSRWLLSPQLGELPPNRVRVRPHVVVRE